MPLINSNNCNRTYASLRQQCQRGLNLNLFAKRCRYLSTQSNKVHQHWGQSQGQGGDNAFNEEWDEEEEEEKPWYLWTTSHLRPWRINMNHNKFLTWGFVEQGSENMKTTMKRHHNNLHTFTHTATHGYEEGMEILSERGNSDKEFCVGAKAAYKFLAECFIACDTAVSEYDVTTPLLSEMFETVGHIYREQNLKPNLNIDFDSMDISILGVWIETGSTDKRDKVFGRWDASELKHYFIAGFLGPEYALESEQLGASPRRLVVAVQYDLLESFHITDRGKQSGKAATTSETNLAIAKSNSNREMQKSSHFWVFETDIGMEEKGKQDLKWRVRNINDAILPNEGEKIPTFCF
eukprot:CAMPEP_0204831858 /NCGR_PEP_ID=MMETSP1346-20131115/11911_1 /ASSEMBLY_ACC=CAM_ASM_000771 /TAXON_ID=215587 /ORGANISM="Aplanochytrium stocchinoi, Strain GSBS06" /LENGTH=350 /DNA_ID=CAMNT_0051963255 /DNA_START=341 /DNA_END=1396 /DNA_ORIENTATION=+